MLLENVLLRLLLMVLKLLLVPYFAEPGSVTLILCGQFFEESATGPTIHFILAREVFNPAHVVSDVLSESLPFVHHVNIRSVLARLRLFVGIH